MALNWLDYAMLGILLLSGLVGYVRGVVRETLSLGVWIAAVLVAWLFHDQVASLLIGQVSDPKVRTVVSYLGLGLAALLAGAILAMVLTKFIDLAGLTGVDRILGFAFGGVRGAVIVAMAVYIAALTPLQDDQWWHESSLVGNFQQLSGWFLELIPQSMQDRLKQI